MQIKATQIYKMLAIDEQPKVESGLSHKLVGNSQAENLCNRK